MLPLTEEQKHAFETLKTALTEATVLHLPRPNLPFILDTDVSAGQIGCALFQRHEDGVRYPIGYWSRTILRTERNYSSAERECLAIVWAVTILRPYLERTHFVINTDHQALTWLMVLPESQMTGRLMIWRLRLLEFDYEVHYVKGKSNLVADAISRLNTTGNTHTQVHEDVPCFLLLIKTPSTYNPFNYIIHPSTLLCYRVLSIFQIMLLILTISFNN